MTQPIPYPSFHTWQTQALSSIEQQLQHWVHQSSTQQSSSVASDGTILGNPLAEPMRYSLLGGGKRIRPLLTLASGYLFDAPTDALINAGVSVECAHTYSLIHDDLPSMDDDDLRRGRPTVHIQYNEATAILVGDGLQALAFEIMTQTPSINDTQRIQMIRRLAKAVGMCGMVGGQALDLSAVGQPQTQAELTIMHQKKTGVLLHCAVMLGADCAPPGRVGTEQFATLSQWAQSIGLGFQVIDDIIDATSTTEELGKTAGKDRQADKPTFVSLMGLAQAQAYAKQIQDEANSLLMRLGDRTHLLGALSERIFSRRY